MLILPHILESGYQKTLIFELGMLLSAVKYDYELVKKQYWT